MLILQDKLDALHKARKAFIQMESSDRIRRALSHNIRTSSEVNYVSGDSVYFKRPNEGSWHGPGRVLGQDGQQILIKNGSYCVRVHKCNVRLVRGNGNIATTSIDDFQVAFLIMYL